jgi:putative FmdB family regulatory protein
MPTYEFRCTECHHEYERVMSVAEHDEGPPECPECGSESVEQILTGFFAKTSRKS